MILSRLRFLKSSVLSFQITEFKVEVTRSIAIVNVKRENYERNHNFQNVCPWKSKRELADYLLENVLYNDNGLIVLNKPYGVGIRPLPKLKTSDSVIKRNTIIPKSEEYCLIDALPYIGNALGVNRLIIAKSAEKYTSGVIFLATSDRIVNKIKTCHSRDMCFSKLTSKYLAVVLNKPSELMKSETVKLALVTSDDGKSKQPLIQSANVTKPLKSKEIKTVRVEYNTSAISELGASLVEIKPSLTKWHFLRVYLSHQLSPILGDDIYSSRVQTCLGIPVAVNPFNELRRSQNLSQNISRALNLETDNENFIPCHLHLQEVTLTCYHKDKSDLVIAAPPPEFFLSTCTKLNLEIKG